MPTRESPRNPGADERRRRLETEKRAVQDALRRLADDDERPADRVLSLERRREEIDRELERLELAIELERQSDA